MERTAYQRLNLSLGCTVRESMRLHMTQDGALTSIPHDSPAAPTGTLRDLTTPKETQRCVLTVTWSKTDMMDIEISTALSKVSQGDVFW